MKKIKSSSISINSLQNSEYGIGSIIINILITILFYISSCAVFINMAQAKEFIAVTLLGIPIIILLNLFSENKKIKYTFTIFIMTGALIFTIIYFSDIFNGIKTIINNIYSASEACQSYKYNRLDVTGNAEELKKCIYSFLAVICIFYSLLLSAFRIKWTAITGTVIISVFMLSSIYFGTLPNGLWSIILIISIALLLSREIQNSNTNYIKSSAAILCTAVIIFGCIVAAAPGENAKISRVDDDLRDYLAMHTAGYGYQSDSMQNQSSDNSGKGNESSNSNSNGTESEKEKRDIKKVALLIAAVLLIVLLLFAPAVFLDKLNKKRQKNSKGIFSKDNKTKICAMFRYSILWLEAYGVDFENKPYIQSYDKLEQKVSKKYADSYNTAVMLWQEAEFSNNNFTAEQCTEMQDFMNSTIQFIWQSSDRKEKLKIKYRYALEREVKRFEKN